ncbi:MAG: amidohydrolase family protein [Odoribacter sp.]|nr:amidohydrolase family protein [Odoribacter sp.]
MKVFLLILLGSFFIEILQGQNVTFYNVNIVDVAEGTIVPGRTVVVENGIITKISKAKKHIKSGQADRSGCYMMPGLIESHSHWGNFSFNEKIMQQMADSFLECGVTTVRDAGGKADVAKQYSRRLEQGEITGPTVYLSSFWVGPDYKLQDSVEHVWERTIPYDATVGQLEQFILEAKEFGCWGVKLYNDLSYEMLQKIVPLCHKHGLRPWGHFATSPASALECVRAGIETVSHAYLIEEMEGFTEEGRAKRYTPEKIAYRDSVYREMVKRGTILDATTKLCSQEDAALYVNTVFTKDAYQAGVKIAAGTDCVDFDHGNRCLLLEEMNILHDSCGMNIPDVLRAATTTGAEVLGLSGKLGIIKKGAEADILLLKSNPLVSLVALSKEKEVYVNGKKVYGDSVFCRRKPCLICK